MKTADSSGKYFVQVLAFNLFFIYFCLYKLSTLLLYIKLFSIQFFSLQMILAFTLSL